MDELTRRRMAHNEAVFRRVNEEIETVRGSGEAAATLDLVCECSDRDCSEHLELTEAEFARIRAGAGRFVVVPGHERPEIERVVEQAGDHTVVEKPAA